MQVDASGWPNETQVERKSKTCVDLRVRLARALHVIHALVNTADRVTEVSRGIFNMGHGR